VVDFKALLLESCADAPVSILSGKGTMLLPNLVDSLNYLIVFVSPCSTGIFSLLGIVKTASLNARCFEDEVNGLIKGTP
jgi:hypothetical protein